jgi:ribosomal protein S18 acetylase RimI-like enzyme
VISPFASIVGIGADPTVCILGSMLTQRPAAAMDDLRTATDLMSAAWRAGSPLVAESPAAIEWWYALTFPDPLGDHLRLWFDGSRAVAWSWHEPPELETHVWSGDPDRDTAIYREIIVAVIAEADGREVGAFAAEEDPASIGVLTEVGFSPGGRRLSQWQRHAGDGPLEPAALPDGYRIRSIAGEDEFAARVDLHRAAFPTSRLTVTKYARLLTVPHYRFDDDLIVEAPDGTLAAFALGWLDPVGGVAELEPVGTHPDHQRRGLSRAVVTAAMTRFFNTGVRTVQVYADASEAAAEALYASVGFHRRAFHQRYVHRPSGPSEGTIDA